MNILRSKGGFIMFNTATITMPYKEFKELMDKVEWAKKILEEKNIKDVNVSKNEYVKFVKILREENDPDIPSYEQWKEEILGLAKLGL